MKQFRALLVELTADAEWKQRAACRGADPNLFFPPRGASLAEPKAICDSCEVKAECRAFATGANEKFGVWGGQSERERRRIRRQRRAAS